MDKQPSYESTGVSAQNVERQQQSAFESELFKGFVGHESWKLGRGGKPLLTEEGINWTEARFVRQVLVLDAEGGTSARKEENYSRLVTALENQNFHPKLKKLLEKTFEEKWDKHSHALQAFNQMNQNQRWEEVVGGLDEENRLLMQYGAAEAFSGVQDRINIRIVKDQINKGKINRKDDEAVNQRFYEEQWINKVSELVQAKREPGEEIDINVLSNEAYQAIKKIEPVKNKVESVKADNIKSERQLPENTQKFFRRLRQGVQMGGVLAVFLTNSVGGRTQKTEYLQYTEPAPIVQKATEKIDTYRQTVTQAEPLAPVVINLEPVGPVLVENALKNENVFFGVESDKPGSPNLIAENRDGVNVFTVNGLNEYISLAINNKDKLTESDLAAKQLTLPYNGETQNYTDRGPNSNFGKTFGLGFKDGNYKVSDYSERGKGGEVFQREGNVLRAVVTSDFSQIKENVQYIMGEGLQQSGIKPENPQYQILLDQYTNKYLYSMIDSIDGNGNVTANQAFLQKIQGGFQEAFRSIKAWLGIEKPNNGIEEESAVLFDNKNSVAITYLFELDDQGNIVNIRAEAFGANAWKDMINGINDKLLNSDGGIRNRVLASIARLLPSGWFKSAQTDQAEEIKKIIPGVEEKGGGKFEQRIIDGEIYLRIYGNPGNELLKWNKKLGIWTEVGFAGEKELEKFWASGTSATQMAGASEKAPGQENKDKTSKAEPQQPNVANVITGVVDSTAQPVEVVHGQGSNKVGDTNPSGKTPPGHTP